MKRLFLRHWHYLLIIFPLLIFIYSIWDHNFYIGGDVMIPLNPRNNIQKMFLWDNGMESFQYVYFFWFGFYYLFSLIGVPAFVTQKILLVLLLIIGFTFTYLLYKEFFKDTNYADAKLSFLAAIIFSLNPIYFLLAGAGLSLYGFPVCFYFLIKFFQKGKILYAVLFSLLLNFFFFPDLPQPKLLIIFGVSCLFLAQVYRQTRPISFKDISIRLIIIFLFSILLNLWILIPLLHDMFFGIGATFAENLITYGGDADFGVATLPYIMRFFNYNIVRYYPHLEHFFTSPVFVIWTFTQWIILVLSIFFVAKDRKGQKIFYILLISLLFFVFIAKGSNPPLGELYRYIVIHFSLARAFRTTSSVIVGAVVFYAFLFSISVYYLSRKKKALVFMIIVLNIIIFYPLYFGYKFYNQLNSAPNQKGHAIPDQYYRMGNRLDSIKEDSKVLSIPLVYGYVNKNWPYFGPDILSWITKKSLIYRRDGYAISADNKKNIQITKENYRTYSLNNVRYFLLQKDTVGADLYKDLNPGDLLIENDYFDLYKISDDYFLPHIYPASGIILVQSSGATEGKSDIGLLPDILSMEDENIRSGIFFSSQNEQKIEFIKQVINGYDFKEKILTTQEGSRGIYLGSDIKTPIVEFKKINPTKYRIRVHNATESFPLVFSENFHKGWKAYLIESGKLKVKSQDEILRQAQDDNYYKILDENKEDQASKEELADYINKGWISDLGDEKEREIKHKKYLENGRETLDYIEKYNIDFISKNFKDTIQNDNLSNGKFYETWLAGKLGSDDAGLLRRFTPRNDNIVQLSEENHLMVNGYSNSWWIDINQIKGQKSKVKNYIQNPDGSIDFELVFEFWPQRFFYLGLGISGFTLLICLFYLGYDYKKKRKNRYVEPYVAK